MGSTLSTCRACEGQALFGIVQGGIDTQRRLRHMAEIVPLDFDGHALGGLAVGESVEDTYRVLDEVAHSLPAEKPRYLMGVGTPTDLERGIAAGIDMFDCVMPTRNARNGYLFTSQGRVNIPNAAEPDRSGPDRPRRARARRAGRTPAPTCDIFTIAKEILYSRLATLHNLTFYARHVRAIRDRILAEGLRA